MEMGYLKAGDEINKTHVDVSELQLYRRACMKYIKVLETELKNCKEERKKEIKFIVSVFQGIQAQIENSIKV